MMPREEDLALAAERVSMLTGAYPEVDADGWRACELAEEHLLECIMQVNRGRRRSRLHVWQCSRCRAVFDSDHGREPLNRPS